MLLVFRLLFLFSLTNAVYGQNNKERQLTIGDPGPALKIKEWIKGKPVLNFEKGHIYVVEFWATWCAPCKAAMPHLSQLAQEYKDRITVLGIDVYEQKVTFKKIKHFVDSMGHQMDYTVGTDKNGYMVARWLEAFEEKRNGIPRSFVIDAQGNVAWIGHPKDLKKVLPAIVNNTWNIQAELKKRNFARYLANMNDSINYKLNTYVGDILNNDLGNPDSALLLINSAIIKEPKLKYTYFIASHMFSSLLKTAPLKAFEFGKEFLTAATYENSGYAIIDNIKLYSDRLILPAEIYRLGAEAYQWEIQHLPYPEIIDIHKLYNAMAAWYWRANDKQKAIDAEQKAIKVLETKKNISVAELKEYQSSFQKYLAK